MHLAPQQVFLTHLKNDSVSLPVEIEKLVSSQRRTWKKLDEGYAALKGAMTRVIACHGFSVTLQCNPQRITSTDARTDEQSIRSRKCFLCVENLPAEQLGILYHDAFLILCNPAPIFERHLTISSISHREQAIEGFTDTMFELARDLSPSHTLFYNGPRSGASAPDHMHVQALPVNVLPVERDAVDKSKRLLRLKEHGVVLWTLNDYGRQVIVLESKNKSDLDAILHRLLNAMRKVLRVSDEPMVNIFCSYADETWRVIVFPRTKHRPDEFFLEGDERVVISPAAVDMGGFIVTPLQRDFERVDATMVENIYRQVSQDAATVGQILDVL